MSKLPPRKRRTSRRQPGDDVILRAGDQLWSIPCNLVAILPRRTKRRPWMRADISVARRGEIVAVIRFGLVGEVQ